MNLLEETNRVIKETYELEQSQHGVEIKMTNEPLFIKVEVFFNKYSILNPANGAIIEQISLGFGGLNF